MYSDHHHDHEDHHEDHHEHNYRHHHHHHHHSHYHMHVHVQDASFMASKQDPYVKAMCGQQVKQTHVCNGGGTSPRWDKDSGDHDNSSSAGSGSGNSGSSANNGKLQFEFGEFTPRHDSEKTTGEGHEEGAGVEVSFAVREGEEALVLEVYSANTLLQDDLIGRCAIGACA